MPPEIPESLINLGRSSGFSDVVDEVNNTTQGIGHENDTENHDVDQEFHDEGNETGNLPLPTVNKYSIKKSKVSSSISTKVGDTTVLRLQTQLTQWFDPLSVVQAKDLHDKCLLPNSTSGATPLVSIEERNNAISDVVKLSINTQMHCFYEAMKEKPKIQSIMQNRDVMQNDSELVELYHWDHHSFFQAVFTACLIFRHLLHDNCLITDNRSFEEVYRSKKIRIELNHQSIYRFITTMTILSKEFMLDKFEEYYAREKAYLQRYPGEKSSPEAQVVILKDTTDHKKIIKKVIEVIKEQHPRASNIGIHRVLDEYGGLLPAPVTVREFVTRFTKLLSDKAVILDDARSLEAVESDSVSPGASSEVQKINHKSTNAASAKSSVQLSKAPAEDNSKKQECFGCGQNGHEFNVCPFGPSGLGHPDYNNYLVTKKKFYETAAAGQLRLRFTKGNKPLTYLSATQRANGEKLPRHPQDKWDKFLKIQGPKKENKNKNKGTLPNNVCVLCHSIETNYSALCQVLVKCPDTTTYDVDDTLLDTGSSGNYVDAKTAYNLQLHGSSVIDDVSTICTAINHSDSCQILKHSIDITCTFVNLNKYKIESIPMVCQQRLLIIYVIV